MPAEHQSAVTPASPWGMPGMFAFNLLALFIDRYGTDAVAWHPAAVLMEIEEDENVDIPPGNFDRLMTALSLLQDNAFYQSVPDFARACLSLSGHVVPDGLMSLPDAEDIAWGLTEGMLIAPPDDPSGPFSEEVRAFIGAVTAEEGMLTPPDVLRLGTGTNPMSQVSYDYSDDPELFGAIQDVEEGRTERINRLVIARLHALFRQLRGLQLREGRTTAVEKLLSRLPPADEDSPLPS